MASFSLNIQGQLELVARLAAMSTSLSDGLEDTVRAGALLIENEAQANAPSPTGALARSISTVTASKTASSVSLQIGPQVEYAASVEYGASTNATGGAPRQTPWVNKGSDGNFYVDRGVPARPFLRPAFEAQKASATAALQEQLVRLLGVDA